MAVEILLPMTGSSTREGQVVELLVRNGARVTEGQPLFSVKAGNASSEIEAPATGTLKVTATPGAAYEAGTVLGYIE